MLFAIIETLHPSEQEFFISIYEQYKRIMFQTARKYVSDITVAEDLVQDAIVRLIPKITTMRKLSQKALVAYVVATVRNVSINYLRHQQRTVDCNEYSEMDEELHSEFQKQVQSPEEILLRSERSDEFYNEWNNLKDKDRDVLLGKYIFGMTDRELAKQYGCKPNSIRMVLTRARRNAIEIMQKGVLKDDKE